jgi:hypothetical protein
MRSSEDSGLSLRRRGIYAARSRPKTRRGLCPGCLARRYTLKKLENTLYEMSLVEGFGGVRLGADVGGAADMVRQAVVYLVCACCPWLSAARGGEAAGRGASPCHLFLPVRALFVQAPEAATAEAQ